MDNIKHISELLEKFYAGDTNLEEERELVRFFSDAKVPEELAADKELFVSMHAASESVEIPADLNEKIISSIDAASQKEVRTRRINFYAISGLAAGLLIILSVYLGFIREQSFRGSTQFAVDDPEIAYQEVRKALAYVSSKWNEGTGELENLETVNKTMNTMRPIKKITSGSKELNLLGNLKKADNIKIQ